MNSEASDYQPPTPDLSRIRAFLSRCQHREAEAANPTPSPQPPPDQFDIHHGLTFDKSKRRHIARFTVDRGGKLVGKRVAVRIPTTDADVAVMVRDAVLDFCLAIGLKVNRRRQSRSPRERGEE